MSVIDVPPTNVPPTNVAPTDGAKQPTIVEGEAVTVPASIVPAEGKTESREHAAARYIWATTRIGLGFIFLWAFFDKLFGWGIGTLSERSWLNGGSPTTGYLKGVRGPFAEQFNWLAGRSWVDWLFMIGLFAIGVALVAGIGMRIAAASGALLLVFMWMASLPILTNPFLDDHLIYALVIVGLALVHAGDTLGFGRWWSRTALVHRVPVLV